MPFTDAVLRDRRIILPNNENIIPVYKMIKGTYRRHLEEFLLLYGPGEKI